MTQVDRTKGGFVTALTANETQVVLDKNKTYELTDVGFDSSNVAQTAAKVFYTTDNRECRAAFTPEPEAFYLFQSSVTEAYVHRIKGVEVLRVKALTAESTMMIRPVV